MKNYLLSLEAVEDIAEIRRYLSKTASRTISRHVLSELRAALRFLAENPGAGHWRRDLTVASVKFWPVFSYLVIYDPAKRPLGITRVLHGSRNVETLLRNVRV